MGAGHSHRLDEGHAQVPVARVPAVLLLIVLAVAAVATTAGAVRWWPDHDAAGKLHGTLSYAVGGTTYVKGTITQVQPRCPKLNQASTTCGNISAAPVTGPERGQAQQIGVPPEVLSAGLEDGDTLVMMRIPPSDGSPATYTWYDIERGQPLWILAVVFALAVIAVARWRGLLALVSLAIAGGVIGWFLIPAILTGEPALVTTVVAGAAIMFLVLYLTHGVSMRTSTALLGTLVGIVLSAVAAHYAVDGTHLNGVIDDGGSMVSSLLPHVSLHNVLKAAAVIAGLGALNDVTITQASSVWELRAASPEMSRWALYRSAMRIGRDHVASAIYTLAFAYVGSALTLLLALGLYDRSIFHLLGSEEIAEEIVRSLAGGLGLLVAMPVTTLLGVLLVRRGADAHSRVEPREAHGPHAHPASLGGDPATDPA